LIKTRGTRPIIVGDFNIYKLAEYKKKSRLLQTYQLSSEVMEYTSYPDDKDTLDYVAVNTSKYAIAGVMCHDTYVSDHRALSVDIQCE